MSVEVWVNLATFIALAVGMVSLYFGLRRPMREIEARHDAHFDKSDARFDSFVTTTGARFDRFEAKTDARFDRLECKIDDVHAELAQIRIELARHDERIYSLEGRQPKLVTS